MVTGDFNGDGHDDLAVGAPGETVGTLLHGAGAVNVLYGGVSGLSVAGDQIWTQASPGVQGEPKSPSSFGRALAVADFNNDGYDDLAVGVPGDGPLNPDNSVSHRGAVNVLYGSPSGLRASLEQRWTQDSAGVDGVAEKNDHFGSALAACDFDGDGFGDVAIGVPSEGIGSDNEIPQAGAVNVLYGSANGLTANGNQIWTQDTPNVEGVAEERDHFGLTLSAGDFDGDGRCDLVVGVPVREPGSD